MKKTHANNIQLNRDAYNAGAKLAGDMRSFNKDYNSPEHKKERSKKILDAFTAFYKKNAESGVSEDVLAKEFLKGWKESFFDGAV